MHACACRFSADGSLLVAKRLDVPGLWLSYDNGATWNLAASIGLSPLGSVVYHAVAGSPDGQTLVLASTSANDYLLLSTDRGEPRPGRYSCCARCSAPGDMHTPRQMGR